MTQPNDLRLHFLNEQFETVYVLLQGASGLNYESFEWASVFHKQDKFSLKIGVSNSSLIAPLLDKKTMYVLRSDTRQIGCVQKRKFEDGRYLEIDGIGIEGLLAKRFTKEEEFLPTGANEGKNYVGAVMCDIINSNNPFFWLVADREKNAHGPSIYASTKDTGNVYKTLTTLAKAYDVGFTCRYDEAADKVYFQTIPIVSIGEDIIDRVDRFSDDIGNVKGISYEHDNSKHYNYIRVIGENGHTAVVDQSNGGERYELSKKSRTRQRKNSVVDYMNLLHAEGIEELAKRKASEAFIVTPKDDTLLELGWEALSMTKHLNISSVSFCTEIQESWESTYKREYTFGYPVDAQEDLVVTIAGELE